MTAAIQTLEHRLEQFEKACRDSGVKLTHQRLEIFREIARTGDHPDAETVHQRVRKRLPMVSLDTVYRTLWLLKDMGLITTLGSHHQRTRFDANLDNHHHFVCVRCGLTQDFYSSELDGLHFPETLKSVGIAEAASVEVRGICHTCAQREKTVSDQTLERRYVHE